MSLKSMTGFSRADGRHGVVSWHWEARSVNGRGLDVRLRLPPGYDALEPVVREAVAKRFTRGSITVGLAAQRETGAAEIRLNETALQQVLNAASRIQTLTGCERPRPEGLLQIKGVLEVVEPDEDEALAEARVAAMMASLAGALDGLGAMRSAEGQWLAAIVAAQLDEMERLISIVEKAPGRSVEAIRARIAEQVARLVDASSALDPQRLVQEAVLVATRADVEEELKRLRAHVAATRELLTERGSVGRKLDFLTQELNREANTLCSKSNDGEVTRAGLALKSVVDQMREQVQNIE